MSFFKDLFTTILHMAAPSSRSGPVDMIVHPVPEHGQPFSQLTRVYHYMKDGQWRTLQEIASVVGGATTSISARLRDLRKTQFGSFNVERQRRTTERNGVYEYRVINECYVPDCEICKERAQNAGLV